MPYSEYRPELMGSVTLEPSGRIEAGSWQQFTLVYTAGQFGIDDTGSVKIGFRFATDFGPVQFADPKAPGFTTVEASNGAELDVRWEFKRNIRPWSRTLYVGIKKHFLADGDTLTIRFGDQSQGSRGIRVQTYCESAFEFRVFVDAIATYDYVPLPNNPAINIVPGPPVAWRAVLPTLVREGAKFRLSIKGDDKWGNPSDRIDTRLRLTASHPVDGLPETVRFEAGTFATIIEGLSTTQTDDLRISVDGDDGTRLCTTNPLRAVRNAATLHFWGDLHGQSNETLGTNTARDYFLFARDRSFLDVAAHQGNDFQMTSAFWRDLNALTGELNEPGRFVTFPGYEWSANTAVGGDRNVFYASEGRPMYRSSHAQIPDLADEETDAHDAHQLFEKLRGEDCVVWSHCGGRYADITYAHDGRTETSVEVHSAWGTFEWLLHDAFAKDFRVGIVCNSDGHKGRPGASYPGASFFGSYGGLTCYLAPELSREAIMEAMRRRHHFGTTGNRMFLDVRVTDLENGALFRRDPALFDVEPEDCASLVMGDIAQTTSRDVDLSFDINGSAPIERVDIFDGPRCIKTFRPYTALDTGRRVRLVWEGAEYRGRARTTNWEGELKLEQNAIERAEMFNNWNIDRGVVQLGDRALAWKAVTTGNFGGIDLWLTEPDAGTLSISTNPLTTDSPIALADIGYDDMKLEAGGLGRALRLYRLPDDMAITQMHETIRVPLRTQGDTRLYVRVTQEDGHRAWSSPIYLIRKVRSSELMPMRMRSATGT